MPRLALRMPPSPRHLVGNAVVFATLPGQRAFVRAPRARIEAARDRNVRRMVRFAAAHVPHYRDLFPREHIDPREIRTAADLVRLPVLAKDEVRRAPMRFVPDTWHGRMALPFYTSGSTGERTLIHHDRRSLFENIAYSEREREVTAGFVGQPLGYREAVLRYPGATGDKVRSFYAQWTWLPGRPNRRPLSVLRSVEENAASLAEFQPHLVSCYGSYLEALHRAALAGRIPFYTPRVLVYTAEPVLPAVRAEIERAYGVPVVSAYNAVEAFKMAFHCERRDGFHVHEDLCHLRILDAAGADAAPGVEGDVVISNLVNRGTVRLNYRLGDRAALADEACACGRTLGRLREIDGRAEDLLALPNGRLVHPRGVWAIVKTRLEVRQYQLVQVAPAEVVMHLVTADDASFHAVEGEVAHELGVLLGPDVAVRVVRSAAVPRTAAGKVRMVVGLGTRPA
jgi:phenylacetate-CoA ligase